jgi:glyoxylase-like metal-dependent hydrolase (beta-lactamase superfamily II)/ferredoxin
MADQKRAVKENVPGEFFVDSTCINCDTCRQLAPSTFEDVGDTSAVKKQPQGSDQQRSALRALICCPTASIGTRTQNEAKVVIKDFPLQIEDNVFYCGFNSAKSYGGNSFFVQHDGGNWLIDSPRLVKQLSLRFAAMGGIKYIFLTHQDDVADAAKYASQFGAKRIIHKFDLHAQSESEMIIEGDRALDLADDFKIIPQPGHTRGHMVLLYKNRYLFSGDHLFFDPEKNRLTASKTHCWYSWERQAESMQLLSDYHFTWVLPGHGHQVNLSEKKIHEQIGALVRRMGHTACQWDED